MKIDITNNINKKLYELLMDYCVQQTRNYGYAYLWQFRASDITFSDVYNSIVECYTEDADDDLLNILSILLIQTKNNSYYCFVFMKNDTCLGRKPFGPYDSSFLFFKEKLSSKSSFLKESSKDSIETNIDTTKVNYSCSSYVILYNSDELIVRETRADQLTEIYPEIFSYWDWLNAILTLDVHRYVLLEKTSDTQKYVDEKNMYFTRPYLVDLCENANFYYIPFETKRLESKSDDNSISKILATKKMVNIKKEHDVFRRYTQNKKSFLKYWRYAPNPLSMLIIRYCSGLANINVIFGYETWYTELYLSTDKSISVNQVFDLFDKQFKTIKEVISVVLCKLRQTQNYLIFFTISGYSIEVERSIISILGESSMTTEIQPICNLRQNVSVVQWLGEEQEEDGVSVSGRDHIQIDLNSLVVGLYTKDKEYWTTFFNGRGIFKPDIEYDENGLNNSKWVHTKKDVNFMKHYVYPSEGFLFIR